MTIHKTQIAFVNSLAAKCSGTITQNEVNFVIEGQVTRAGKKHPLRLNVEALEEKTGKVRVIVTSAPTSIVHREFLDMGEVPVVTASFNTDDGPSRIINKATQAWEKISEFAILDCTAYEIYGKNSEEFLSESQATASLLPLTNTSNDNGIISGFVIADPANDIVMNVRVVRNDVFMCGLRLSAAKASALIKVLQS